MATSPPTRPSTNRHGGLFFVAGALVIACGVIGYLTIDAALRRDRPAPFVPSDPPRAPDPVRQ